MKNIVLCAVLATSALTPLLATAEQAFCVGGAAGASTVTADAGTDKYVKIAFTPKCSANVHLKGNDVSTTTYTVGAASTKGKSKFQGSTNGGSITGSACAADPCAADDAASPAS
ncbi:MAG TPA: hypothetical protein PKN13_08435 [Accumulibacter sp.]|nr:hypothetical protein [Accumulibacter sp.]HMW17993.1 hypothetical protein [Accumulibacter sp.]HMX22673.1 hypothetical protein [Accumulibacter sp.]HMY06535.1 hypothetical protein [Accumulibacter sp.]HNC18066.1 hypothetical protein [Accumulibacter sp.]